MSIEEGYEFDKKNVSFSSFVNLGMMLQGFEEFDELITGYDRRAWAVQLVRFTHPTGYSSVKA
jgi:hypothetical protein